MKTKNNMLVIGDGDGGSNIVKDLAQRSKVSSNLDFLFTNTNEISLDSIKAELEDTIPSDVTFITMGPNVAKRRGAGKNVVKAFSAYEESAADLIAAARPFSIVILIGTTGKSTALKSLFPLSEALREEGKVVIPVVIRSSVIHREVEQCHYDLGTAEIEKFDNAEIRIIEVLNDYAYQKADDMNEAYKKLNDPLVRSLSGLIKFLSQPTNTDINDFIDNIWVGQGRMAVNYVTRQTHGGEIGGDELDRMIDACFQSYMYQMDMTKVGAVLFIVRGKVNNLQSARMRVRASERAGNPEGKTPTNPYYKPFFVHYEAEEDEELSITAILSEYHKEPSFDLSKVDYHAEKVLCSDGASPVTQKPARSSITPAHASAPIKRVTEVAKTAIAPTGRIKAEQPVAHLVSQLNTRPNELAQGVVSEMVPNSSIFPPVESPAGLPIFTDADLDDVSFKSVSVESPPAVELAVSTPPLNGNGHAASVHKKLAEISGTEYKAAFSTLRDMIKEASLNNPHARAQLKAEPSEEFRAKMVEGKTGNSIEDCLDILKQHHHLLGKEWKELCLQELRKKVVLKEYEFLDDNRNKTRLAKDVQMEQMEKMLNWDLHETIKQEIRRRIYIVKIFGVATLESLSIDKAEVDQKKTEGFLRKAGNWLSSLNS